MKVTKYTKPWVDALRSGDYRQGHTFLHLDNKFCCLGVALDVMGHEWVGNPTVEGCFGPSDAPDCINVLTPDQYRKLGISYGEMRTLYDANDALNKSFDEIAAAIEAAMLRGGEVRF